jgi:hypothetical protein
MAFGSARSRPLSERREAREEGRGEARENGQGVGDVPERGVTEGRGGETHRVLERVRHGLSERVRRTSYINPYP